MKKAIVCLFAAVLAAAFSSAQSEPVKIRIGYASALHGQVAKALGEAGIARKHGLEAELSFFQYGPPQAEALASKNLDVSFTSLVPTSSLLSKKPGYVKVVAALGSSVHGLVVQGGGDIKTLADLKGKTIGLPFGSDSHVDLLVALKAAGLDPATDVKLQNLAPNEQAAPFQQKLVDGVLARPPLEQRLQKEFGGREIQQWPHHLWAIARTDYLNENPGVEARLQAAITEAVLYVVAHPEETAGWFAQDLRQKPEAVQAVARFNPLYKVAPESISVVPGDEIRAFARKRSAQLVDIGFTKEPVVFFP
ncbi:MAG TPA: ABC transporter substrate-binding protein [Rariglobus sp.]